MNKNKKKWTLLLTVPIMNLVNADSSPQETSNQEPPKWQDTYSGNYKTQKAEGVFINADWLFWNSTESGLSYATVTTMADAATTDLGQGEIKNPHFQWKSGFRVGFGYNTPYDDWNLSLNWTSFYDKSEHASINTESHDTRIFPAFIHPQSFSAVLLTDPSPIDVASASADWKMHLNVLDLELGKWISIAKRLNLSPFIGFRNAWIDQTYQIDYDDLETFLTDTQVFNSYNTSLENNYWGFGIRTGFNSRWDLYSGLSVYANTAFAILYGLFHLSDVESATNPFGQSVGDLVNVTQSLHAARATTDLQIGVRWDKMLCKDRFHISLQAGWEQHLFFSQNQFLRFVNGQVAGSSVQNQGDLSTQGWNMGGRFDF